MEIDFDPQTGTVIEKPDVGETDQQPKDAPEANVQQDADADSGAELHDQDVDQDAPTGQPYDLALPPEIPARDLPVDFEQQVAAFAEVAAASGIGAQVSQRLLNLYADLAYDHRDYGKSLTDPGANENAEWYMRDVWGDQFDKKMKDVRRGVEQLGGDKFRAYLADGLGNDPACVEALQLLGAGALTVSKGAAQKGLETIMQSPEFTKPKSAAEARRTARMVRLFTAIANEDDAKPTRRATAGLPNGAAALGAHHERGRADARAEIASMMREKDGALMNRSHPQHQEAVKKFHALQVRLP